MCREKNPGDQPRDKAAYLKCLREIDRQRSAEEARAREEAERRAIQEKREAEARRLVEANRELMSRCGEYYNRVRVGQPWDVKTRLCAGLFVLVGESSAGERWESSTFRVLSKDGNVVSWELKRDQ